ncbi:MAG: manganese efflux pump MntP family protein [Bacteroidales bacterium]|nr:manganese efflux pump MntP family protein [Bacteroidales bacterium]
MVFYIIFARINVFQMDYVTIFAIAIGLCFDTFAVSLSYGVVQYKILFRQAMRLALLFAVFQGGLTVAGYFLGSIVSDILKTADHWIALGLLSALGIKMIIEGLKKEETKEVLDYSKLIVLLTLALGTSIDAFAVGISFALLDVKIWTAGIIIGFVTFLASMVAIRIGKSAGERLGNKVEIIGGIILVGIGVKIFIEHMLA